MKQTLTARLTRWVLVLGLLLAAAGCGDASRPDRVTIMIPWSGDEFQAFYAVLTAFEKETGIQVDVQVTRALTQQLDAAVTAGAPPDLAMLPSVGAVHGYAQRGNGKERTLQPLDVPTGAYLEPFRGLATVRGKVYAVPVKVDVKSLVWFARATTGRSAPPDLGTPGIWCLGLESGPTSGWPGADWIADILLARTGSDFYTKWLAGTEKWRTPQVDEAWTTWRALMGAGVKGAAVRNFGEAAAGMTTEPPKCSLAHGALSAMGFDKGHAHDFVTSSRTRRLEVSADFVGMFTDDNPSAEAFIAFLAGTKAQQLWVDQAAGAAFSADSHVTRYATSVQQRIAQMLRPSSGYTLCFGAADAMTPDVSAAFYRAVLDYATATTTDPDRYLGDLDQVQEQLGSSPVPRDKLCAGPE
ncbi:ABC transporter substrate-binding protein [Streptomyces sp. NPDC054884]|uniref:ABC transporter substrate-binding protein n=1 Tax=Streptomyces sp. ME08-AFT2 TaxID=3028683 RepID=UPI0029B77589|nr:extracellular solute-binding protein [Streptomyces sp. ME08-AFT2]MDX3311012.1 extracellular solute-binding protein [Streptomyces sp. ME08-AFT2]